MGGNGRHERATQPEHLGRLFVERANAGEVDGLVELYEPERCWPLPMAR